MSFDLAVIFGFLLVSAALLFVLLSLGRMFRARKPDAQKLSTYECGERPFGSAWFNFNNRFYVIALVFVAFDVQLALSVPIIVIFRRFLGSNNAGATAIALFSYLGFMILTLAYVWRHGDLSWVREIKEHLFTNTASYKTDETESEVSGANTTNAIATDPKAERL
ncbi:MAG: NADH-quinone oxidoreductase subunit A [Deltaproteobacteria bacterium]|nr:NADH-quinone oxidoreductase subunit A [Deltaproteobacteria bacterium]